MRFDADEARPGTGGRVTLWAGDRQIGEGEIPRTIALIFTTYAGMDIGRDNGGVVDLAYEARAPYAFTGTVRSVVFDIAPEPVEQQAELHAALAQAGVAHEPLAEIQLGAASRVAGRFPPGRSESERSG